MTPFIMGQSVSLSWHTFNFEKRKWPPQSWSPHVNTYCSISIPRIHYKRSLGMTTAITVSNISVVYWGTFNDLGTNSSNFNGWTLSTLHSSTFNVLKNLYVSTNWVDYRVKLEKYITKTYIQQLQDPPMNREQFFSSIIKNCIHMNVECCG